MDKLRKVLLSEEIYIEMCSWCGDGVQSVRSKYYKRLLYKYC